jgi:signal transduction histidine kinase
MKITTKLTAMVVILTLVIVMLNIAASYLHSESISRQMIQAHLNSVSILKANQMNYFVDYEQDELVTFSNDEGLRDAVAGISARNGAEKDLYEARLREILTSHLNSSQEDFLNSFIIDQYGTISVSTDPAQEGKVVSEPFFSEGKKGSYIQNFYYDPVRTGPSMTMSAPINDKDGRLLGVLAGNINIEKLSDIMVERSGLGNTGETILVNQYNYLVSKARFLPGGEFTKALYTDAVKKCLKNKDSEFLVYNDYRDVKVMGIYTWIPEREVCLIAKIDYDEVMAPIIWFSDITLGFGLLMLIFSVILAILISRKISKPITLLRDAAVLIGNGELSTPVNILSGDEIQDLAETISSMEKSLKSYQERILDEEKNKGNLLEKEVEGKTRELRSKLKDLDDTQKAILNMMEDMKEANEHLKELDQAKSNFLNIVSHELKTPLTAIVAHLDVLDDIKADLNGTTLHSFEAIRRNTNNLKMLIANILEISRMESGKFELAYAKFDFSDLIMEVAAELDILSNQKGIVIIRDIGELPMITADETRLREVITNLLTNAIKFTEKGTITIKARKEGENIQVSVSDTGVGILPENIGNLFVKFYQVDPSISRRYGGTGLGLSITRQIINAHGGDIRVESVLGRGTTFSFNIPLSNQSSEISEVKK